MSTCSITNENQFYLHFLAGMYQKSFNECDLSEKDILGLIYMAESNSFSPNRERKHLLLLDSRGTVAL